MHPHKLNATQILAAGRCPITPVEVEGLAGVVNLKLHNLRDVISLEEDMKSYNHGLYMAVYLSYSIVDDAGARLFASREQVEALAESDPGTLIRLYDRAVEINIRKDAKTREKNEGAAPQDGLPAGGAAGDAGR